MSDPKPKFDLLDWLRSRDGDVATKRIYEQAAALIEKLPMTCDKVRVVPHVDEVWAVSDGQVVRVDWFDARTLSLRRDGTLYTISDCYSTREAAEVAAQATKETP